MQTTSRTATRVNLGPLTTTFNPPSDCTSLRFITSDEVFMGAAVGYGCYDSRISWGPCPASTSGQLYACSSSHDDTTTWFQCSTKKISGKIVCSTSITSARHDFSLIESCYPSGFASSFGVTDDNTGKWTSQPLVYSPGLACPSGYLPQCTVERAKGLPNPATGSTTVYADNVIWSMLNEDETAIGCCPS